VQKFIKREGRSVKMIEEEKNVEELERKINYLSSKLKQTQDRIRTLEYDNADLQKWVNDTCVPRMQEMSDELVSKYNQKQRGRKNYNELQWKRREIH